MLSLSQGKRKVGDSGQPIFNPFPQLEKEGIHFRRSQLSLVAAAPGGQKSSFTLFWLLRGQNLQALNRCLVFSADTDAAVQYKRAAQIVTGFSGEHIDQWMDERPDELDQKVREGTRHVAWSFLNYPDADDIRDQLMAYLEVWGDWPEVLLFDNLKNVRLGDTTRANEADELEGTMEFLQLIARETGAAVIALHHVTGTHEDGDKAIPLSGIRGKVSKTPETILTLWKDASYLYVTPVKNRDGKADSSGHVWIPVQADLSRMSYI